MEAVWGFDSSIGNNTLRTRQEGVQRFTERHDPSVSLEDMQDEFREHSGIRPGGDLLQVSDAGGVWLFQSSSIRRYRIALPAVDVRTPMYETVEVEGNQLRVLTAGLTVSGRRYTAQLAAPMAEASSILRRFAVVVEST